jgi:hypothetical protein
MKEGLEYRVCAGIGIAFSMLAPQIGVDQLSFRRREKLWILVFQKEKRC